MKQHRFGRLLKRVAVAVVLLAVLVAVLPLAAAPFVRRALERAIEEKTGGKAAIAELSFSLFGSAQAAGIDARDSSGRPLGAIERVTATFSLIDLLTGRIEVEAEARGVALHVRLEEDGRWNLEDLGHEEGEQSGVGGEAEDPSGLPDIGLQLSVANADILVHGAASTTSIAGALDLESTDLAAPASLHLDLAISGPGGPAGSLRVTAELTAASEGRGAGLRPAGTLEVLVEALDLAAFEHLAVELAPLTELAGVVSGRLGLELARDSSPRADMALALDGFQYQGLEPEARLALAQVRLEAQSTSAEGGGFHQSVRLAADELLTAVLDGVWLPGAGESAEIAGTYTVDASLGELSEALRTWLPLREGASVDGRAGARGEFSAGLEAGELRSSSFRIDFDVADFEARDAAGAVLPLDELGALAFSTQADLDFETGRLSLTALELSAGPVSAAGRLALQGPLADPATELVIEDSSFTVDADLDRLRDALSGFVDLDAVPLGGSLHADLTALSAARETQLAVALQTANLVFGEGADGTPRDYGELEARIDAQYFSDRDHLELTSLALESEPLAAQVSGRVDGLTATDGPKCDLAIDLQTALELLRPLAQLEEGHALREARGGVTAQLAVSGAPAELEVEGTVAIAELDLELVTEATGDQPWALTEPLVTAVLKGTLSPDTGEVRIDHLRVDSTALRGEMIGSIQNALPGADAELLFEGLSGEVFYIPDRVGALLSPWLPGELSGADEERVTFTLDGQASGVDLSAILAGSRGSADIGLGRFAAGGFDTAGTLHVEFGEERASWSGTLAANGGSFDLRGQVDLRPTGPDGAPPRSTLEFDLKDVGANSKLGPLLGRVHPAFSAARALEQGQIGGLIDCDLALAYEGPVTADLLAGGWEAFPKLNLSGAGRLAIRGASLTGSPLFAELIRVLGLDLDRGADLEPIEFSIDAGRLRYARPWTWTIGDTRTTFIGSVGLDESLALTWEIPIDDALVSRYGFLSSLRGERIQVPLGGSVRAPSLEWQDLLTDLASRAAQAELIERLGLGGGGAGAGGQANGPAALLAEADRLWQAGQKVQAAALYGQLREQHKLTLVYALNRDRIKERAQYREED